ncbi:MAG: SUMF1/EgtB/PvdO family nonheme iron enzyme [Hyphomonadaceae bacterium]|nr:SUMF1/EgtB/PvdO family nonheme iron enzyme [Hyphomonadaceae bacterium]
MAEEQAPAPAEREERTVRLASIVSIDIVGFSTMSERDQRKAARHVENLRARIIRVAESHGGRLFNTAGDGFMLEFGSAGAALEAVQDILDKRQKGEPTIRVGAHVGDVVVTLTQDLLGHGVNVAARLQELAAPGSALVSAEFRSMARNSPSAAFQARGRQPLENIEQRVQTFEILSRRQKLKRLLGRVGWTTAAIAVAAALIFVGPIAFRALQDFGVIQADASADTTAAPAPTTQQAAALPEDEPAAPAGPQPGESFRDCANCPEMVVVAGGLFSMGSPSNEAGRGGDEGPQREVSIAPLAIGKYEITFAQWDACLAGGGCNGFSPPDRGFGRGDHPVIGVSWNDAQAYLDWLNAQAGGLRYRLLTEAEWEYAARGATTEAYFTGRSIAASQATYRARATTTVGAHAANGFGLFDMNGNAAEWVEDCYAPNFNLAPIDGAAVQADNCTRRVYRGGAYTDQASALRSAARRTAAPAFRGPALGFRVARTID